MVLPLSARRKTKYYFFVVNQQVFEILDLKLARLDGLRRLAGLPIMPRLLLLLCWALLHGVLGQTPYVISR